MATIKTFSQIVQSSQDNIRLRRPALDTKPGTVARDIFIDNMADQVATVYRDIQLVQKTQSLLNSTGQILDQYGSNYGIIRDPGKRASGSAILTFNNLINNINIASGTTVTAKTGVVFRITANILISASTKGVYASYASSISDKLHIAGISDQYAIQVPIESLNIGSNGNIPIYSLIKTSIPGISNVTNISPTSDGTNPQGDPQYRNQIIAGLSGSAAGTARGYQNAILLVSSIQSVYIAVPGDPILTRDGTVTQRNTDGSLTVLSPGTGGKVDIWLQGNDFVNITESYVFHDISGTGDITSSLNAHILGQTTNTVALTPLERRQLFTQNGQLSIQPVDSIVSLSGSISGANFVQGVNYSIIKDTNPETANTAFALDKIIYLQNFVSISGENVAKGNINSVDSLVFSGIKSIDNVQQNIIVTNDLATLDHADHTQIILSHKPLSTVLRATNLTTGERYTITNQNIDPTTGLNKVGIVNINGSILPSAQDLIQVDYIWNFEYDSITDYFSPNETGFITTGIDWGKSNYITMEEALLIRNSNRYNLGILKNIDRVYSAFYSDSQIGTVQQANLADQTGIKAIRQITIITGSESVVYFIIPMDLTAYTILPGDSLIILSDLASVSRVGSYTISNVVDQAQSQTIIQIDPTSKSPPTPILTIETGDATIKTVRGIAIIIPPTFIASLGTTAEDIAAITNVVSVKSEVTGLELYATNLGGSFSGNVIFLATDVEQPDIGESVVVYFNSHELFNIAKNNGSVNGANVILSTDDVLDFNNVLQPLNDIFNGASIKPIFVNYIVTDIDVVARTAISSMPFIGSSALSTLVDKNNNPLTSRQPIEFDINGDIIRSGPSYLTFILDGAFSSGGAIAVKGTGWFKITASVPISQINVTGLFNLNTIINANVGSVSNNYSIAKVASASINNGITIQDLLLRGYALNKNTYDVGIAVTSVNITQTSVDLSPIFVQNDISILTIGSVLTITFYVLAPNISESIQFTNGRGTLYSEFKYTRIDRIDLISGFLNPSNSQITGNMRIARLSQPNIGSTYLTDYSYFGPVENERITIQYRYNNVIQDATTAIEAVRTLTADVLTRLAFQIVVNISITVILINQAINQQSQILDQATSAVNNLITSTKMGAILDYSAFLRVVTAINGVEGADVTLFDFTGSDFNGTANRKSIQADADQYFVPGTLNIVAGVR